MSGINDGPFDLPEFEEDAVLEGLPSATMVQLPNLTEAEATLLLGSLGIVTALYIESFTAAQFMLNVIMESVNGKHKATLSSLTRKLNPLLEKLRPSERL